MEHHIQEVQEAVVHIAHTTGGYMGRPYYLSAPGYPGEKNGGAGGLGFQGTPMGYTTYAGQGAGNPGGTNGTGGTLIIYAQNFNNTGTITANGSQGGESYRCCSTGGGSGGGSINIFYNTIQGKNTMYVNGGIGGIRHNTYNNNNYNGIGGTGGTGTISIGSISTGTYVSNE